MATRARGRKQAEPAEPAIDGPQAGPAEHARPSARRAPSIGAALSAVSHAVDGDRRLMVGVAERALQVAPAMLARSSDELEAEANKLNAACADLVGLREKARGWWSKHRRDAAGEAAIGWTRAKLEGGEAARPLAGGRHLMLEQSHVDWMVGAATAVAARLEGLDAAALARVAQRSPQVLPQLDAAVERVDRAARAVAAAHALDVRDRVDRARERAGHEPTPPVPDVAGHDRAGIKPPIDRHGRAFSEAHARLLARYAEAIGPSLRDLGDAALVNLRQDLPDPWQGLNARVAQAVRRLEHEHGTLLTEYRKTRRSQTQFRVQAEKPDQSAATVTALQRAADDRRRTADALWRDLRGVRDELETQRAADGSPDMFLVRESMASLHHAVHVECQRRGLDIGKPTPMQTRAVRRASEQVVATGPAIGGR